jgi:hypothetical protein
MYQFLAENLIAQIVAALFVFFIATSKWFWQMIFKAWFLMKKAEDQKTFKENISPFDARLKEVEETAAVWRKEKEIEQIRKDLIKELYKPKEI